MAASTPQYETLIHSAARRLAGSGDGTDQVLTREDGSTGYWYQTDDLGSVRDVFASSGSVTYVLDHVEYSAFGEITSETNSSVGGRYKYTAEPWDSNTGLQYNRARYYDPATGEWTSQDPSGFAGGSSNLYEYVGNDATNATDPSGLQDVLQWGKRIWDEALGEIKPAKPSIDAWVWDLTCRCTKATLGIPLNGPIPREIRIPSSIKTAIEEQWRLSFLPNGKVQEHDGSLIVNISQPQQIEARIGPPGDEGGVPGDNFPEANTNNREVRIGTFHTHPYLSGNQGVGFSFDDINLLLTRNYGGVMLVGAGSAIYLLVVIDPDAAAQANPALVKDIWEATFKNTAGTFQERVDAAIIASIRNTGLLIQSN
jgi:RHS repeat-associated protein